MPGPFQTDQSVQEHFELWRTFPLQPSLHRLNWAFCRAYGCPPGTALSLLSIHTFWLCIKSSLSKNHESVGIGFCLKGCPPPEDRLCACYSRSKKKHRPQTENQNSPSGMLMMTFASHEMGDGCWDCSWPDLGSGQSFPSRLDWQGLAWIFFPPLTPSSVA